jgi:hypothetical protein
VPLTRANEFIWTDLVDNHMHYYTVQLDSFSVDGKKADVNPVSVQGRAVHQPAQLCEGAGEGSALTSTTVTAANVDTSLQLLPVSVSVRICLVVKMAPTGALRKPLLCDGSSMCRCMRVQNLYNQGYGGVLDSGTTFTYLPTDAFNKIAQMVGDYAAAKGLQRRPGADPQVGMWLGNWSFD